MPAEDILMIGYPIGISDRVNNFPVFRQGIAATHPGHRYNGKDEFLIDAACYPGSSGSPVVVASQGSYYTRKGLVLGSTGSTRFLLLGVLYAGPQYTVEGEIEVVTIPTANVPIARSKIPINLGLVIRSRRILDFEPVVDRLMEPKE